MKTVIMAGGRGTRISSIASDIPKPMIKIEGKPVLEHEIECLRDQGFKDIILTVSHLGNIIMDYFGNGSGISPVTGKSFGVNIEYYFEKEPLGNAGALFKIKDKLTEDFLLLNADAMFDVDFNRFVEFHKLHGGLVTLFTHPNSHPYDSGLIIADENGTVQKWLAKEDERPVYYKNRVNAGLHVISPEILNQKIDTPKIDLDRQLLKPLSGTNKMFCYDSPEYVKDMGTPDRYYAVCEDFKEGHVQGKNLKNKQRAIFLDRDGTINKYVGFLRNINEFELIDGVSEAIKKLNESGYLTIIVTNQPVIARGEVSFDELDEIHIIYTKMINPIKEEAEIKQLLPLYKTDFQMKIPADIPLEQVTFRPSPEEVMNKIVPAYIEGFVFGALVESYSCEQNARMMAMEAATKSAKDMLQELSVLYNRARQAAITQEITEVIAGAKSQKNKK